MRKTGMLGNNKVLRQVWDGPLGQIVGALNGPDGQIWLRELKKFARRELCW